MAGKSKNSGATKAVNIAPPTKPVKTKNEVRSNLNKPLREKSKFNFLCSPDQHAEYQIWCIERGMDMTAMFFSMVEHCKSCKSFK